MSFGCILLGAPGSGKGTQAKKLQSIFQIPHISTGDILRSEIQKGSSLGKQVGEVMASGKLVSDDLISDVVESRFKEDDVRKGFILDGYPRTLKQAEAFSKILGRLGFEHPIVVNMNLASGVLKERLLGRLSCSKCGAVFHNRLNPPKQEMVCDLCGSSLVQRKDDSEETVIKRIKVFEDETAVLLDFYSRLGVLQIVDASQGVDVITKDLEKLLRG